MESEAGRGPGAGQARRGAGALGQAAPSPELALERGHLAAHGLVALRGLVQLPLQLPAVGVDALGLLLGLLQLPFELLDLCVAFLCLSGGRPGSGVRLGGPEVASGRPGPAAPRTCSLYCSAALRSSSTCSSASFSFLSFCFSDLAAACFSLRRGGGSFAVAVCVPAAPGPWRALFPAPTQGSSRHVAQSDSATKGKQPDTCSNVGVPRNRAQWDRPVTGLALCFLVHEPAGLDPETRYMRGGGSGDGPGAQGFLLSCCPTVDRGGWPCLQLY